MCVGERETQPHWCYFPSSTLAGLLLGLTNKAYLWMTGAASMCATLSKSPAWPTPNHRQLGHSLFQQEQLSAHSLSLDQPPNRERRGKGGKRSVVFMVYTACPCSLPAPVRGERRGLGMQGRGGMALFCSRPFFSGSSLEWAWRRGRTTGDTGSSSPCLMVFPGRRENQTNIPRMCWAPGQLCQTCGPPGIWLGSSWGRD